MTTTNKDPRAVIEQLVTALGKLLGSENYETGDLVNAWAALTAGRKALAEQREVGYGLYLEFNGELHLEYPIEASYDDCVLRLQEYEGNRGYEIRECYIIPTGVVK